MYGNYQELPDAPWITDCERTGYPSGFHYRREDGFLTPADEYEDETDDYEGDEYDE